MRPSEMKVTIEKNCNFKDERYEFFCNGILINWFNTLDEAHNYMGSPLHASNVRQAYDKGERLKGRPGRY